MRRKQTPKKVLMLHLDFDLYEKLLEVAESEDKSLQSLIRESVKLLLKKRGIK